VQEIALTSEHITLGQLLKLAGLVDTGGEARAFLEATDVAVNGEPEQRRGRKLRAGDLVEVAGGEPIRLS
jgi:S4 domain protein YaaA